MKYFVFIALLLSGLLGFTPANADSARARADLNMRSGPGTGYRVIGVVPRGVSVNLSVCRRSWCLVFWRGRRGWVSSKYLRRASSRDRYIRRKHRRYRKHRRRYPPKREPRYCPLIYPPPPGCGP